jgi:hypothetical protein
MENGAPGGIDQYKQVLTVEQTRLRIRQYPRGARTA